MEVVRLVGVERRSWTDKSTGEVKEYCGLHVVHELTDEDAEGLEGKKVESFTCPKELNSHMLKLDQCYELVYSHYRTKNGLAARISDLKPVEE